MVKRKYSLHRQIRATDHYIILCGTILAKDICERIGIRSEDTVD